MPEQLEPVDIIPETQYLWGYFCSLSGRRKYGEGGPFPIEYPEIESWARMRKIELTGWELDIIESLDRAYLTEATKK
jgi:hypothetical protein